METPELKELLDSMIGNTYSYKGKLTKFEAYRFKEKGVSISNSSEIYLVSFKEIDKELTEYVPVEDRMAIATLPQQTVLGSSGLELKNLLLDNIKKIQEDKSYIPQAIEVNANIKSIIDLAKAEVELYKALNQR